MSLVSRATFTPDQSTLYFELAVDLGGFETLVRCFIEFVRIGDMTEDQFDWLELRARVENNHHDTLDTVQGLRKRMGGTRRRQSVN